MSTFLQDHTRHTSHLTSTPSKVSASGLPRPLLPVKQPCPWALVPFPVCRCLCPVWVKNALEDVYNWLAIPQKSVKICWCFSFSQKTQKNQKQTKKKKKSIIPLCDRSEKAFDPQYKPAGRTNRLKAPSSALHSLSYLQGLFLKPHSPCPLRRWEPQTVAMAPEIGEGTAQLAKISLPYFTSRKVILSQVIEVKTWFLSPFSMKGETAWIRLGISLLISLCS